MAGEWKLLHPALYQYSRNLDHLTGARTLSPWSPESWPCDPVEPNVAARSVLWALGRREPEFEESIGSKCFPKRFWVSSLWSKIVVYKAMMTETSYGSVKSSLPVLNQRQSSDYRNLLNPKSTRSKLIDFVIAGLCSVFISLSVYGWRKHSGAVIKIFTHLHTARM